MVESSPKVEEDGSGDLAGGHPRGGSAGGTTSVSLDSRKILVHSDT